MDEAERLNAIIAIGDLKGIRHIGRGRRFNRKLNSWPFWKLRRYIEYGGGRAEHHGWTRRTA